MTTIPARYTDALDAAELESITRDRLLWRRADREAKRITDAEERPPVEPPEVLTLAERLARPIDPVQWCVEGWLPAGGRAVMAAQAKTGKTTAAANLVRSLVDGQPWLGRDSVTPVAGTVAVLDFEMSERQLDAWYRAVGIANAEKVLLLPMRGKAGAFDLRDDQLRAQWAALFVARGVEFVVWDCLRPTLDALGLDEHRDAGALLTAFDALLEAAGKPGALVVHHMGHNEERSRGDSRIRDWPDVEWKLVRDGSSRFVSAYGRDVEQHETQYAIDEATKRLTLIGGSRAQAKVNAAADAVIAALAEADEPMTVRAIESLISTDEAPRQKVRDALAQLVAMQHVLIEPGPRNARLHRLNREVSVPVRRSVPEPAGALASQCAAGLIGGTVAHSAANQDETNPPWRAEDTMPAETARLLADLKPQETTR